MGVVRRLFAVLVCVGMIAGPAAAACAGWMATPQERMACCEDENCPMHKGRSHDSASGHGLTQAEADSCCAASEGEDSSPSTPTFAAISLASSGPAVLLPASVPALVLSDGWRTASPIPSPPIPRHLLLSVFLV